MPLTFRLLLHRQGSRFLPKFVLSTERYFLCAAISPIRISFLKIFNSPGLFRGEDSSLAEIFLSIDSGPSVRLLNGDAAPQVTLRSQGGLDQNMIRAQQQNADTRGLTILDPIYVVESSVETAGVSFQLALPPPLEPNKSGNGVAMFQWDSQFQQWLPLRCSQKPTRYV